MRKPGKSVSGFYQAVRQAARELGIKVSGLHRLRSNYAQEKYRKLLEQGKTNQQARREVSQHLGHNRIDVVGSYIPQGWEAIKERRPNGGSRTPLFVKVA